ncbi:hypothetical protein VIGAN_02237300 [Vigna angularis var. angularis]|uniref:Uncharacterized protein n=1 Tax=Vigna angularis var. angularis TaxID=157739 RepID=A0A0S3RG98_PHAAN|nr:hypothetical protein VIGAN_02237300 [Vigna angularis var. angularis]
MRVAKSTMICFNWNYRLIFDENFWLTEASHLLGSKMIRLLCFDLSSVLRFIDMPLHSSWYADARISIETEIALVLLVLMNSLFVLLLLFLIFNYYNVQVNNCKVFFPTFIFLSSTSMIILLK